MKLDNKIKFTDKALANVKHADYEFTYVHKDGSTKTRPWLDLPFENLKHTRLKGLKFRLFRNGGMYFVLHYWFQKDHKVLTLGEYNPGILGKREVEEKLYKITKTHLADNGYWLKDPALTEKNKTRVLVKEQVQERERKTINEVIIDCLNANLPRGKRDGNLRARSMGDMARYLIGYNWRLKHMSFVDVRGSGTIKLKPNYHKRTKRPESIDELFKKYPPGTGNINSEKLNPLKNKSLYDSPLGKTYIDQLDDEAIEDYLGTKSSYGTKKGIVASLKIVWYFAKSKRWTKGTDPTLTIVLKKPTESKNKGSIHNEGVFDQEEIHKILEACDLTKDQYPFQAESLKFMIMCGQRREQILKLKVSDIDMDNKVIIFPGAITKKGKREEVAITPELADVLIELGNQREKQGEKFKFIPWLFPSVKCNKKRLLEPGYQQSDYTRIKDNKHAWEAVKKISKVGGARKLFRKTWSTEAKKRLGNEANSVTGHDQLATLDRFYNKSKRAKMISDSEKVSSFYQYKKLQK